VSKGSRCKVGLIFHPTATGLQTDTLTIGSNANNQPQIVHLKGTGK
jgi:hypothetical protein